MNGCQSVIIVAFIVTIFRFFPCYLIARPAIVNLCHDNFRADVQQAKCQLYVSPIINVQLGSSWYMKVY